MGSPAPHPMPIEPAAHPAVESLYERIAARPSLTSAPELERLFQRRMFIFNVCFVLALSPLYIVTAIVRASTLNWWMTIAVFGSVVVNLLWTRRHGDYRRGLFWLQTTIFVSLGLGISAAKHFGVDTPSFWWMSVMPVATLMSGLTRLGLVQGALVICYASTAFLLDAQGQASLGSPSLRLHLAVVLSTIYVCANLVFAMFWRGKLQQALQEASNAALASAGAKARFLAHMSHEIRTPLSGVIGAAELLRSDRTDAGQRQQLATLQEQSAKTLLALINDILDWSKLEAGKVQLEEQTYSIRSLVSEANELFAVTSFDKQIELTNSCNPDVPRLLLGDPTRIRQVVNNLAGNAVKFTAKGSVHIHVAAAHSEGGSAARDWLRIEVSDSGAGIASEALNEVFDAFRQADESVTRRYGGTGLGLAISKELAELMGGRIEVISAPGCGSTFTLILPLQQTGAKAPAPTLVQRGDLLACCASAGLTRHIRSLLNEMQIEPHMSMALPGPEDLQGCQLLLLDAALLGPQENQAQLAQLLVDVKRRQIKLGLMLMLGSELVIEGATPLYKPVRRSMLESFLELDAPTPFTASTARDAADLAGSLEHAGPHVLLCEDNPVNQIVVQVMLNELGATVVTAGNGREGLERLKAERFDLILMDMQMPEMDGLSAAREWRRIETAVPRIPIVCMTANSRADGGEDAATAAGMDDFLAKPFGISDLKQCLARWAPQVLGA
jgi:two-component system sensor histidine kinase BarA